MRPPTAYEVRRQVTEAADTVVAFLDSPQGRRMRSKVATGLIFAAPVISRLPVLRRTPFGRVVSLLGGAALIVKAAEMIRDWEPQRAETEELVAGS